MVSNMLSCFGSICSRTFGLRASINSGKPHLHCVGPLPARVLCYVKFHFVPLCWVKASVVAVKEHIPAAVINGDEAVTLFLAKPLHVSGLTGVLYDVIRSCHNPITPIPLS